MKRAILRRLGIATFALFAILAALLEVSRDDENLIRPASTGLSTQSPPHAALQRCQALGVAALNDQACLTLWAGERRRFLITGATPEGSE
ncbi:MAG: putative entry exclusion protein TrbK-alt [Paracoccaceae bacterium]